jgi:hypothetical protein
LRIRTGGAVRYGLVGFEQHHLALGIRKAQRQHFRHELADLARREIHDRRHLATDQLLQRVVRGDLGAALAHTDAGAEIDLQLEGRLAGFREGVGGDDGADADIDLEEGLEIDGVGGGVGVVQEVHGRHWRSASAGPIITSTGPLQACSPASRPASCRW